MYILIREVSSYLDENVFAITFIELPFDNIDYKEVLEEIKNALSKYMQEGGIYLLEYQERIMHWGASDINHELQIWLPIAASLISTIVDIINMILNRSNCSFYEVTLENVVEHVRGRVESWFKTQGKVSVIRAEENKDGYYLELADEGNSYFNVIVSKNGVITRIETQNLNNKTK